MAHRFSRAALQLIPILGLTFIYPHPLAAKKKPAAPQPPPVRATLKPSFTIPAEPLGFAPPGAFYLGMRNALVSLDFLDEDRLLFTFRVPALLHRAAGSADENDSGLRDIRALVLRLPQGSVEAEQVWTLHDRDRYLYALPGGQFLLRDQDQLELGDASLKLKPWLRFPGPILWVEIDPSGQYIVAGSDDARAANTASASGSSHAGNSTSGAAGSGDPSGESARRNLFLRIISRSTGQVLLASHVDEPTHLPIGDGSYLESRRSSGMTWNLSLASLSGGKSPVGSVDSVCTPFLEFLSPREFLASACGPTGDDRLFAFTTDGRRLWQNQNAGSDVWPATVVSAGGLRFARETLLVDHAINASMPLSPDDIKGQDVQVVDAATGKTILRAAASPIFDAGGNVALSPSGRRAAILMNNAIQIFDLPAPPQLPASPPTSGK